MQRRSFINLLSGLAVCAPLRARAQQPTVPVVGVLHSGTPETNPTPMAAFRKGLSEMGFVEGRNLALEYRWGQNDLARLPELAADLVRRRVAVIATPNGNPTAPAKAATTTIPIVFGTGADPRLEGGRDIRKSPDFHRDDLNPKRSASLQFSSVLSSALKCRGLHKQSPQPRTSMALRR